MAVSSEFRAALVREKSRLSTELAGLQVRLSQLKALLSESSGQKNGAAKLKRPSGGKLGRPPTSGITEKIRAALADGQLTASGVTAKLIESGVSPLIANKSSVYMGGMWRTKRLSRSGKPGAYVYALKKGS